MPSEWHLAHVEYGDTLPPTFFEGAYMQWLSRIGIVATCLLCVTVASISTSAQELPENWQSLDLYDLNLATKALEANGYSAADKAKTYIEWMNSNDWRSMELHHLYNLYVWVSSDSVDHRHFSARWTGSLTAPATEAYTLKQGRSYGGSDSQLKVVLDGVTILDSTEAASDESKFSSRPVQLVAGQPVPIVVELVHRVTSVTPVFDFSRDAPMVVLSWKTAQEAESLVPTTAFRPPAGFAEAEPHGLKGEYFGTADFSDLRATRLDPALDLIWSWPPVAPIHQEESTAVLKTCKRLLLDGEFLARSAAEGNQQVFEYNMWRIAYRLSLSERRELVEILLSRPDVLQFMRFPAIARLMQGIYMLPGNEHIELVGKWALVKPQPRCEAGIFPGYGVGYYQALNTDFYWLTGLFMQGPYWSDAETLCDHYLERADGQCNLAVAYSAAYAARANRSGEQFMAMLDERINDESVQGDQLMTWLVARAFAKQVLPGALQPMGGFSDLESAYMVAESDENKFWALHEMVARLSSTDRSNEAIALVEERGGGFTSPQQQAAMADWRAKAEALAAVYAERRIVQAEAANANYLAELERRRQQAADRGDSAAANRFGELISAVTSNRNE
jgi:PA14 domain